jgi:glycosyltransferase involved in cell wall biosynthesis
VRLGGRVRDVGFAAMVEPAFREREARLRAEVRARLHINLSRRVVLVSLMRTAGADWEAFLGAVARITAPEVRAGEAPVIVAMARDAYAVHDAACRAGCQRALRIVGQTERVEALLAAADAAAAPLGARPDAFRSGATGRFIADALRAGRPVLAATMASGVDLLEHHGVEAPGLVVEPAVEAWAEALHKVCDDDWLAARTIGARAAGAGVGFQDWVERILAELGHDA